MHTAELASSFCSSQTFCAVQNSP